MDITKENVDKLNAKLKIRIEEEDYSPRVEKVLNDYRKTAKMDGFRPGKVPPGLIKKLYGQAVLVEEIQKLMSESITKYLDDEKVRILGEPLPSEEEQDPIDWNKQKRFEFTFDLGLAPDLEIILSQKDKVPIYDIQVEDKMVQETKDSYTQRMGQMKPVDQTEDKETIIGTFQQIDKDGNPVEEGIRSEGARFSLEVVKDESIKTKMIARKVGDILVMDIKKAFPNDNEVSSLLKIDKEEVAEIAPDFSFEIKEISRFEKAEVNQEFYDNLYGKDEVKTEQEFSEKITGELKEVFQRDADYRFSIDARNMMVKKFKFDLPEQFLKRWLLLVNKDKFTPEQIDEEFSKYEDDLKWQLIRDRIIEEQGIKVSSDELKIQAKEIALMQFRQYGMMNVPEENLENYAHGILKNEEEAKRIYERLYEKKAIDFIRDNVKVDPKKITSDRFNKLFENN